MSQLGFGLGKILNSEPSAGSIAGIGHSPHVVQEVCVGCPSLAVCPHAGLQC